MWKQKAVTMIVLVGIVAGAFSPFFSAVNHAHATLVDMMFKAFPPNSDYPPITPAGGSTSYQPVEEYTTDRVSLASNPLVTNSDSVRLKLLINLTNSDGSDGSWKDSNSNQQLDASDDFGAWDSIIDNDIVSSGADATLTGTAANGVLVQLTTAVDAAQKPGADTYFQPMAGSTITERNLTPAMFADPTQIISNLTVTQEFNLNGLTPGTTYYARIRLAEDQPNTADANSAANPKVATDGNSTANNIINPTDSDFSAYSKTIQFTTPATNTNDQALGNETVSGSNTDTQASFFGDLISCNVNPMTWLYGCLVWVYYEVVYAALSTTFLYISAVVMDTFLSLSISSTVYVDSSFVVEGWKIIRDLANILLIFILLYIAIGTILKLHSVDASKMLPMIIIVGLLINFSLFFTRVIIDAGNTLAHVFYNEITVAGDSQDNILNGTTPEPKSIGYALASGLNLDKMVSQSTYDKITAGGGLSTPTIFLIVTLGIVVNLMAAWVFLQCSFFFLGRILGLWFSMIFAPFAFVTSIVPSMSKMFKNAGWDVWLSNLISLTMMAPFFILFIYLTLLMLNSGFFAGLLGNEAQISFIPFLCLLILQFMLILGLINQAKKIAKEMSGEFGAQATAGVGAGLALMTGAAAIYTGGMSRMILGNAGKKMADNSYARGEKSYNNVYNQGRNMRSQRMYNRSFDQLSAEERGAVLAHPNMQRVTQSAEAARERAQKSGLATGYGLGNRINKSKKTIKDVEHARHELDDATDKVAKGKKWDDKSLLASERAKIEEKLAAKLGSRKDAMASFGHAPGVKYDDLSQPEKDAVDKKQAELGMEQVGHLKDEAKMNLNTARVTSGVATGTYDFRNLDKASNKLLAFAALMGVNFFKQMNLNNTPGVKGHGFENFVNNLKETLQSVGKDAEKAGDVHINVASGDHGGKDKGGDSHGGGGHH